MKADDEFMRAFVEGHDREGPGDGTLDDAEYAKKLFTEFQEGLAQLAPPAKPSVVYYIRFCCRVKIGTTTNLGARLTAIPHHELLVIEPGGVDVERKRHLQFAHLRDVGEWFFPGAALQAHIKRLQAKNDSGSDSMGATFGDDQDFCA